MDHRKDAETFFYGQQDPIHFSLISGFSEDAGSLLLGYLCTSTGFTSIDCVSQWSRCGVFVPNNTFPVSFYLVQDEFYDLFDVRV